MSDLIDRQAAIDEIEYEIEMINSALDSITLDFNARERLRQRRGEAREILNSIQQLPSAQPEQCEDAVSRTEAKKILYDFAGHIVDTPNGIYRQAYKTYMSKMDKLPSVTPKQRTGKWIKLDMHRGMADHKCTACEQECYVPTCMGEPMYAFCPNCGAKMEVTE